MSLLPSTLEEMCVPFLKLTIVWHLKLYPFIQRYEQLRNNGNNSIFYRYTIAFDHATVRPLSISDIIPAILILDLYSQTVES